VAIVGVVKPIGVGDVEPTPRVVLDCPGAVVVVERRPCCVAPVPVFDSASVVAVVDAEKDVVDAEKDVVDAEKDVVDVDILILKTVERDVVVVVCEKLRVVIVADVTVDVVDIGVVDGVVVSVEVGVVVVVGVDVWLVV
jgi:hypothetical protein